MKYLVTFRRTFEVEATDPQRAILEAYAANKDAPKLYSPTEITVAIYDPVVAQMEGGAPAAPRGEGKS